MCEGCSTPREERGRAFLRCPQKEFLRFFKKASSSRVLVKISETLTKIRGRMLFKSFPKNLPEKFFGKLKKI